MKVISKARQIDAIQWRNDDASLQAIQQLLAPWSPWRSPSVPDQLGVPVTLAGQTFVSHAMQHVENNGWVTVDRSTPTPVIAIWTDAQFKSAFTAPELIALEPLDLDRLGAYAAEAEATALRRAAGEGGDVVVDAAARGRSSGSAGAARSAGTMPITVGGARIDTLHADAQSIGTITHPDGQPGDPLDPRD